MYVRVEENRSGIVISAYDSKWKSEFLTLKQIIEPVLKDLIIDIEHVGSTSIEGLGAKPILDIDIVIEDYSKLPEIIACLEELGYFHQEDWSFKGREAFGRKDQYVPWSEKNIKWMDHHLYVCNKDSEELARHLAFRDYLRNNPDSVAEYEQLKIDLARRAKDRKEYTIGKTDLVNKILELGESTE